MKKNLIIKKNIDKLRQDLIRVANEHGMDSYEALVMSKKLDRLLNIYQARVTPKSD